MRVFRRRIFCLNKVHREGGSSNRTVIIFLIIMAVGVSAVTSCSRAGKPVEYKPLDDIQRLEYLKQNPTGDWESDHEISSLDPYGDSSNEFYKFYYIDKTGSVVIGPEFTMAGPFSDGLARVRWGREKSAEWGYINQKGKTVIGPGYNRAETFLNRQARVEKDGMKFFINRKGRVISEPRSCGMDGAPDGLLLTYYHNTENNLRTGYIAGDGQLLGKPEWREAYNFFEGLGRIKIVVGIDYKFGFVDNTGEYVIEPILDEAYDFHEGLAAALVAEEGYEPCCYGFPLHKPGKWGFINKQGDWVIEPTFDVVKPFFEGLAYAAIISEDSDSFTIGYINTSGEWVIDNVMGNGSIFVDGRAIAVSEDGKYHCINAEGEIVGDAVFDRGMPFFDGMACVKVGDKWGFINTGGEMAIEPQFEALAFFSEGLAAIASSEFDPSNPINMPALDGYINTRLDEDLHTIKIFDAEGNLVSEGTPDRGGHFKIHVPPGVYTVELYNPDHVRIEKFSSIVEVIPGKTAPVPSYNEYNLKD